MRLALLALIFLLLLTLGNAMLYRRSEHFATAHDAAPLQLTQARETHYEWDAFVWREIGAVVVTALLFGAIASAGRAPRSKSGSSSRLL